MLRKIQQYSAILAICVFLTGLAISMSSFTSSSFLSFDEATFDDTGTDTGSGSGGTVPSACPEATITTVSGQTNNVTSCNCTVSVYLQVGWNPPKFELKTLTFKGIQNSCNSGSESQSCDAFACSSTQTGGGSGSGTGTGTGSGSGSGSGS
ncbi:hypothetical protein [Chitinophaga deserti]|uniref:hypothetical protein n=1 Tax=Chitinophaga deserti TaxID=2164099 RepID=UPI0013005A5C|nr:hypothetical protein [Chitinophaga deserti]